MTAISNAISENQNLENIISKAELNEELKVYKVSLEEYIKASNLDTENMEFYYKIIDIAQESGNYKTFVNYCLKAMDKFPSDEKAYLDLCTYYYSIEKANKVVEIAFKANTNLEDSSKFKEMYFDMAYRFEYLSGKYTSVRRFVSNYAPVLEDEAWGLINSNGKYILKPQYENISALSGGMASVDNGDEVYYINQSNEKILACEEPVDEAYSFISGLAVIKQGDLYGYATSNFKLKDVQWEFATSYLKGVAAIKKDGKWAIRDISREMVTDFIYDDVIYDENLICSNASVIFVKENNQYYLLDLEGNKVLEVGFEDAKPFTSEGIAPVKKDGKWGFISASGSKIIEAKYDDANAFHLGTAPVKIDGQWVYIDKSERVVIEGEFEEARSFSSNGVAPVKVDGYWTYIKLLSAR